MFSTNGTHDLRARAGQRFQSDALPRRCVFGQMHDSHPPLSDTLEEFVGSCMGVGPRRHVRRVTRLGEFETGGLARRIEKAKDATSCSRFVETVQTKWG